MSCHSFFQLTVFSGPGQPQMLIVVYVDAEVMLRTCCFVMDAIRDTIFIALNPS